MKKYFLVGLFIRFLVIVFTFRYDLIFIWERPAFFLKNLNTIGSYYGPLTYITFGILSPIYFLSQQIGYWVLKIPYLFVDIYILFLLLKLSRKKIHKRILIFWWLNPIVIFSAYAIGQLDIIMALCVALSVFVAKKNHVFSIISVGTGVAYKTMTLPLLLPLTLILEERLISRIKIIASGLSLPVLLAIIFWLPSHADISNTYFPTKMVFYPQFSLTPDSVWEYFCLIVGIVSYFSLQFYLIKNKRSISNLGDILFSSLAFFIIALPIYSVFRYTVLMPLLVLVSLKNKKTLELTMIIILLMLGYVYTWPLQWGLIAHIYPQARSFPALREWVAPVVNYENVAFIFRVIADLLILYMAAVALKKTFTIIRLPKRINEKLV